MPLTHFSTDLQVLRPTKRIFQRLLQGGLQIVVYTPTESVERMGRAGCVALQL